VAKDAGISSFAYEGVDDAESESFEVRGATTDDSREDIVLAVGRVELLRTEEAELV
jgi:hypothetical protein